MLDSLKAGLLDVLPAGYLHDQVERNWEEMMVYAMGMPIQFLHLVNIIIFTNFNAMNIFMKIVFVFYMIMVFSVHEAIRIVLASLFTGKACLRDIGTRAQEMAAEVKTSLQNAANRIDMRTRSSSVGSNKSSDAGPSSASASGTDAGSDRTPKRSLSGQESNG